MTTVRVISAVYLLSASRCRRGLGGLLGGEEQFVEKLDALFVQPSEVEGATTFQISLV